jgi:hypothetical protein
LLSSRSRASAGVTGILLLEAPKILGLSGPEVAQAAGDVKIVTIANARIGFKNIVASFKKQLSAA